MCLARAGLPEAKWPNLSHSRSVNSLHPRLGSVEGVSSVTFIQLPCPLLHQPPALLHTMYNMMISFLQVQPQHVRAAVLTHSSRPKSMTVLASLWGSLHYPDGSPPSSASCSS